MLNSAEHEISVAHKRSNDETNSLKLSDVVFILLLNVKMPTIVNNCWHFNIYEQDKLHAQLSLS